MKRVIAFFLCLSLILSSCAVQKPADDTPSSTPESSLALIVPSPESGANNGTAATPDTTAPEQTAVPAAELSFTGLSDPTLLRYIEDTVYANLVDELNSDSFFVENVSAIYVSKEYVDELAYNSQANIYFGYTLAELEEYFEETKFVFTLGDDGQTTVQAFEEYDDTYDKVVKNVAFGTGVILLCVTVSVVTGGAAPAVSVIFAASAKSASIFALSGGVFSGVASGVMTGIETKDFDAALKAAALAGSESFKWGAITGAVTGGASKYVALKGATRNGLTLNQVATIQKESKLPLDVIKQFHNMDEANTLLEAGLKPVMLNNQTVLVPNSVDLNLVDEFGATNLQRLQEGKNIIDSTGKAYEWHHIGQRSDGTLALLTQEQHDNKYLHGFLERSEINRTSFARVRKDVNGALAQLLQGG